MGGCEVETGLKGDLQRAVLYRGFEAAMDAVDLLVTVVRHSTTKGALKEMMGTVCCEHL